MKKHWILVLALDAAIAAGCQAGTPVGSVSPSPSPSASAAVQANEGDRAFIDGMVPHHEGALTMADDALSKANTAELKDFARKVKEDQAKEIAEMKAWRQSWFGSSMTPMDHDAHQMTIPAGADFDTEWAEAMITHHQGAIEMSQKALTAAARPECKALAQRIIDAQQKEIEQLRAWIQAWDD